MTQHLRTAHDDLTAARVRQNAGSAAVAAALMVYFGFFSTLTVPTNPASLFDIGNVVFIYVLRIGGVGMAILAVASLVGAPIVLLVDALLSGVIGVLLIVSGVLMLADGGAVIQTVINVGCGALFIGAARRNGRDYTALIDPADRMDHERGVHHRDAGRGYDDAPTPPPGASLASQLLHRHRPDETRPRPPHASVRRPDPGADAATQPAAPAPPRTPLAPPRTPPAPQPAAPPPPRDAAPPPDGFLAAFAEDDPPDQT
ncbi:MAG: hypothetical protein ACE5E6_05325 [Phycisphaerae bacterium]